jgi:hypothetical protein
VATLDRPLRARFLSAHFLFAPGSFVEDVPYDPDLYFLGEEITLSIRAHTHGYDLFHPCDVIVWHEYTRQSRPKHWDDHVKRNGVDLEWHERDAVSRAKVHQFLAEPNTGHFGCGAARTFADYEAYAGINFAQHTVSDETRLNLEPPPPTPSARDGTCRLRICLDTAQLEPLARRDATFWYVGFHDEFQRELYREDALATELATLLGSSATRVELEREFRCEREPATWTVWPYSRSAGWLEKLCGAPMVVRHPVVGH